MKIKEVNIKNFKSFKELNFNPDHSFGVVNMIYGYNNSGKSNLMKFLHLLFKKKYGGEIVILTEDDGTEKRVNRFEDNTQNFWEGQLVDSPFFFTNNDVSKNVWFSVKIEEVRDSLPDIPELLALYDDNNSFTIEGEFEYKDYGVSNVNLLKCFLNGIEIFANGAYFDSTAALKGNSLVFNQLLSTFNNSVLLIDSDRYFSNESDKSKKRELTPKNFKNWLYQLYLDPASYEQYMDLLSNLESFKPKAAGSKPLLTKNLNNYPLNDIDLGFSKSKDILTIMLNKNGRYPIENYGTGVQQLMYILAKFISTNPKVLLIEELELNLSPEYQKEILNYFKSLTKNTSYNLEQIIFTSHSSYMAKNDKVDRFYAVAINDNGSSKTALIPRNYAQTYFDDPYAQDTIPLT
ncbi:AAA family ATPase [Allomuricauda sp. R78024]|uniref:AAA family ATPase n=1 Tax=Allomuricauda sp. R78024 TaxID=3093867 RepID=UPI0037C78748